MERMGRVSVGNEYLPAQLQTALLLQGVPPVWVDWRISSWCPCGCETNLKSRLKRVVVLSERLTKGNSRVCRINTNRYTQWEAKRKLPKSLPGQLFAMWQGMDKWPVQHFLSASSLKGNSVHKRTVYLNTVNLPSYKKYNFKTFEHSNFFWTLGRSKINAS